MSAAVRMSQVLPFVSSLCLGKSPERFRCSPGQQLHRRPLRGSLQSLQRDSGTGHRPDQASSSSPHDSYASWTSGELQVKRVFTDDTAEMCNTLV